MAHPLFELDAYRELPLWAQVLLAARLLRRAVAELLSSSPPPTDDGDDSHADIASTLRSACDAAEQCASRGEMSRDLEKPLRAGIDFSPTAATPAATATLWNAMYFLIDATAAANASESFSAADAACSSSVGHCLAHIAELPPPMSALRVRILLAADVDLLRFACKESHVGTYDPIPKDVLLRLTPA